MLTRLLRRAAIVAAAAMALVCLAQVPALAGGGPGGTRLRVRPVRPVVLSRSARSRPGPARGRDARHRQPGGTTSGAGTVATGGTAAGGCSGTMNTAFGCVPAGCTLTAQTVGCPIGVAGAAPPPGGCAGAAGAGRAGPAGGEVPAGCLTR